MATDEAPNLPPEIVLDIFKRLPVKSLLKFMCVSKFWCYLIFSPSFVKSHLEIAEKDSTFTHHRIVFVHHGWLNFEPKQTSLRSVMEQPSSTDAVTLRFPSKHPISYVSVVGSHNGLICILSTKMSYTALSLWNPATRVQATLPTAQFDLERGFESLPNAFGFGYSKATEHYKVLGFFDVQDRDRGIFETIVKMFSHRANSWTTIASYKKKIPQMNSGQFVNGKLHFAMLLNHEIVSIDLDDDTFGRIEPPDYGDDGYGECLGVLGDCLCVLYSCSNQNHEDLWVLKEYGIMESWTKLFRIQLEDNMYVSSSSMFMLLNGEILMTLRGESTRFAIYNPSKDEFTYHEITDLPWSLQCAFVYVESLVSPQLNATSQLRKRRISSLQRHAMGKQSPFQGLWML